MQIFLFTVLFLISNLTFAGCPSEATIDVQSSTYSGRYNIELRSGQRPGSKVVGTQSLNGNGSAVFSSVCPGKYFFAFGTPDSDQVSVTQYFNVTNDGYSFSNPVITVVYTRSTSKGNKVGSSKRSNL
jgi:hypothetical protein